MIGEALGAIPVPIQSGYTTERNFGPAIYAPPRNILRSHMIRAVECGNCGFSGRAGIDLNPDTNKATWECPLCPAIHDFNTTQD